MEGPASSPCEGARVGVREKARVRVSLRVGERASVNESVRARVTAMISARERANVFARASVRWRVSRKVHTHIYADDIVTLSHRRAQVDTKKTSDA